MADEVIFRSEHTHTKTMSHLAAYFSIYVYRQYFTFNSSAHTPKPNRSMWNTHGLFACAACVRVYIYRKADY